MEFYHISRSKREHQTFFLKRKKKKEGNIIQIQKKYHLWGSNNQSDKTKTKEIMFKSDVKERLTVSKKHGVEGGKDGTDKDKSPGVMVLFCYAFIGQCLFLLGAIRIHPLVLVFASHMNFYHPLSLPIFLTTHQPHLSLSLSLSLCVYKYMYLFFIFVYVNGETLMGLYLSPPFDAWHRMGRESQRLWSWAELAVMFWSQL
jgi:hypothetical protein